MTKWQPGYLLCENYNYLFIFGLNAYDSATLKRRVIKTVDDAIKKMLQSA